METAFETLLDEFTEKLASPRVVKTPQAIELESMGYEVWLKTMFPRSFKSAFCDEQRKFWYIAWRSMYKRWMRQPMTPKEYSILVPFARGMGKSTGGEATCIMEGAVVGEGYDLYLSDTDEMAELHLYAVLELLGQGQVEQFYPGLANPKINELTGTQAQFTKKALFTESGWGIAAKGMRGSGGRGGRMGTLRFTMVMGDDMDRLDESLVVVNKKLRTLSRSVLGAGTTKMQFWFLQNVIEENSMMDQMLTGETDICSERIVVNGKPTKAFKELELEPYLDEGRNRWRIVRDKTVSTWDHLDLDAAEKFLSQSGKDAFMAEYQHEFDLKKDKVVPNFNRKAQVITWGDFQRVFGSRYIPEPWIKSCAADFGYSEKSHSAWTWCATSPENAPLGKIGESLAGLRFTYRGHTYTQESIDKQMLRFWKAQFPDVDSGRDYYEAETNFGIYPDLFMHLWTDPRIRPYLVDYHFDEEFKMYKHPRMGFDGFFASNTDSYQISHEKSGELLTIHEKYGVPVVKIEHFGSDDGVSQWNEMCARNPLRPHPFFEDNLIDDPDGDLQVYEIGCPGLFYIVDEDEYMVSHSDAGLHYHLGNVAKWKYVKQNETESGVADAKPVKMPGGDTCDSERAVYSGFGPRAKELTAKEKRDRHIAVKRPDLTETSIAAMDRDQKGFALAEKAIVEEEWNNKQGSKLRPKGLESLDF